MPTDRIYLCCGATDMRRGINSLARMVQQVLALNPHTGAIFCFRGRKGHIIKILAHDDQGFCLFTKRLSDGCFAWPVALQLNVRLRPLRSTRPVTSLGLGGAQDRRFGLE
ncbi:IS66 family insertion sequence element accessory protein TnpB [Mesorhizobium sp. M8A.F.Ca.ET.165.01.1.1]|nr:IS66 family insertion sequence element accessory protein TnpB [Mesorhizobium sp. M8A.F.Ca.ET.165.01.1.1]